MNEKSHWNNIAANYNKEIFDVFASDRKKKLPRYFRKHGNGGHHAIDFGCGTGKALPYIAPLFRDILAIDISEECLHTAKQSNYDNVSYSQMDLAKKALGLEPAEFVFCCNVIMLPEIERNETMFRNIQEVLTPDGTAIVVVPSLDSILYASWRLIDWYRLEGTSPQEIPATEISYFKGRKIDILQGLVHIDGVMTKHYSQPELEVLMDRAGLSITNLERLEYNWNTEFNDPPEWMGEPYPWDWLIELKKKN